MWHYSRRQLHNISHRLLVFHSAQAQLMWHSGGSWWKIDKQLTFSQKMDIRLVFLICLASITSKAGASEAETEASSFLIEGKIAPPDPRPKDWFWTTRISLDGGKRSAFLKVISLKIPPFPVIFCAFRMTILSPLRGSRLALTCWRCLIQIFTTSQWE